MHLTTVILRQCDVLIFDRVWLASKLSLRADLKAVDLLIGKLVLRAVVGDVDLLTSKLWLRAVLGVLTC